MKEEKTMKRKLLIGAISAGVILGGAVAAGATKNDYLKTEGQQTQIKMISSEEAIQIALTKAQGQVESVELEQDLGKRYFEVEIENGEKEFEIGIDAITGDILFVKEDQNDDDDQHNLGAQSAGKDLLSIQKASEIAEKETGGKVVEISLDDDNNQLIYEVELQTSKGEAELDIDAVTGKVLNFEEDQD